MTMFPPQEYFFPPQLTQLLAFPTFRTLCNLSLPR